ncbi:anti-anti-sigma regulatory factor [Actinoplanes octamycinicus]|uniref:Anti-anti-sigma regulatory factor n=1 Tax=Actinoplanes octamycinicus TaxID=135948 RepID=A0A7W7H2B5_9ACTN|nr:ATP-binding protein [Actinoplanes octamycinicus]MBB4742387.1 anti-anti-sigma regulatory factor [Actinoplanes octamycinicus]GIE62364.1 ATP-binding protein [Actinoplanes octamycinicus]
MQTTVERCLETGVVTLRFDGDLCRATAPAVRTAIAKAAAECPTAVVVDLSGLSSDDPASFSVFASATFKAESDWGVPLLLYGARPEVCRGIGTYRSFVSLYEDRALAMTAMRAYVPRWVRQRLAPEPGSATAARALVGDACLMWSLPHVRDTARLIVSELASNAILHAGTDFDVTAAHTGRYLRIAVRDGSPAVPRPGPPPEVDHPEPGWGLRVVEAASTHWGTMPLSAGKVVWALLTTVR